MTLQERLRDFDAYFKPGARAALAEKAADALDAKDRRIAELEGALRAIIDWHDRPPSSNVRFSALADQLDELVDRAREVLK